MYMLFLSASYTYRGIIVPFAIIVPLFVTLYKYRYLPAELRILLLYILLSGTGNLVAAILAARRINNMPILHVYTALEFLIISWYYKTIIRSAVISKWIYALMIGVGIFCIGNTILLQSIYKHNTYARSVAAIIIIIYALLYVRKILDSVSIVGKSEKANMFVSSGLLLYFGSSLFLFVTTGLFRPYYYLNAVIWNMHATLVLIMYILFTIGLYHAKRN